MRLRDYQELLNRAIPIIEQWTFIIDPNNSNIYKISNTHPLLLILNEYKEANLFGTIIANILKVPNLKTTLESTLTVNTSTKSNLESYKTQLLNSSKDLLNTLNNTLPAEKTNILNLRLPEDYSSIDDYIDFFESIKIVCSPFKYLSEEVTIVNFDTGSQWIGIDIADLNAGLLLSLADKSANLFNKILECRKNIAEIEKAKAGQSNEKIKAISTTIDIIESQNKKELKAYKETLIEEAIKESKFLIKQEQNENEFKNHLRKAMEKLGELAIRGLKIVPAINAKPEIKQLATQANKNIEEKRRLIIGCDNLKYITMQNEDINTRDIPTDTVEINNQD